MTQCAVCKERWPLKTTPKNSSKYVCLRCSRDKAFPKKFSCENNMIPSKVPAELQELTQIEEMLIARALPIMRVYIKPGGQRGYSGHCINLPQEVKELASKLPRFPKDLPVIIIGMKGKENTMKNVKVRRAKIHAALLWLIKNNPHYQDLEINLEALNYLPENGVPSDFLTIDTEEEIVADNETVLPDEDVVYNQTTEESTFLPLGEQKEQQIEAIRKCIFEQQNSMDWPTIGDQPLNEYHTSHLATMAFPTLFPDGKGDPLDPSLLREVSLLEKVKHLIRFAEKTDNEQWVYRFARHPRFAYWAFDMIQRKRVLQQSGIFPETKPRRSTSYN